MSQPQRARFHRRDLLTWTASAIAISHTKPSVHTCPAAEPDVEPSSAPDNVPVVDTCVHLFKWPFRSLPLDTTDLLIQKLQSLGITEAWAGSFEAIFHRNLRNANERLVHECNRYPMLVPIGTINPTLPNWESDWTFCRRELNLGAVRVYPNYHGFNIDSTDFIRLLELAAADDCWVQVVVSLEDQRTQPSMLRMNDVDMKLLPEVLSKVPGVTIQLVNHRLRGSLLEKLTPFDQVYFDVARVDGTDGVPQLAKQVSASRVLFASHAPFLNPESALIRVHESGQLSDTELQLVYGANAIRLRQGTGT